jgi:hypothetical protein
MRPYSIEIPIATAPRSTGCESGDSRHEQPQFAARSGCPGAASPEWTGQNPRLNKAGNSIVTAENNIAVRKGLPASFKKKSHLVLKALGIT